MIIQIYEIQEPLEAEMLIEAGVNHIGSVLQAGRPLKQPLLKETIRCIRQSASKSSLIPLFSDINSIFRALDYYRPDIIHFCENVNMRKNSQAGLFPLIDMQAYIKDKFPEILIIRSIPVPQSGAAGFFQSIEIAKTLAHTSDYLLTDTVITKKCDSDSDIQPAHGFVGITGRTCDWEIARKLVDSVNIPVILAGGLSPDNVFEGIKKVMPAGVDSCTQTNACDMHGNPIKFKKDIDKVKRFIEESVRAVTHLKGD